MKPRTIPEDETREVNDENTVGIFPVVNAAGQKPVAKLRADFLEYAAKVAQVEWGSPIDYPPVYLWSIETEPCPWVALSNAQAGQYPEEAVILAGRVDRDRELV